MANINVTSVKERELALLEDGIVLRVNMIFALFAAHQLQLLHHIQHQVLILTLAQALVLTLLQIHIQCQAQFQIQTPILIRHHIQLLIHILHQTHTLTLHQALILRQILMHQVLRTVHRATKCPSRPVMQDIWEECIHAINATILILAVQEDSHVPIANMIYANIASLCNLYIT